MPSVLEKVKSSPSSGGGEKTRGVEQNIYKYKCGPATWKHAWHVPTFTRPWRTLGAGLSERVSEGERGWERVSKGERGWRQWWAARARQDSIIHWKLWFLKVSSGGWEALQQGSTSEISQWSDWVIRTHAQKPSSFMTEHYRHQFSSSHLVPPTFCSTFFLFWYEVKKNGIMPVHLCSAN